MSQLFRAAHHAKLYAIFRPKYPDSIYSKIVHFCKQSHEQFEFAKAVDVGCGTGQSPKPLAKWFSSVIGVDSSASQIKEATGSAGSESVQFMCGEGENLEFLDDGSVDLITVAQALHWIDLNEFYKEAHRVLKPNGALVAYGYGICKLDIDEAHEKVWYFYKNTLEDYWHGGRHHVEDKYACIKPFTTWERDDTLFMEEIKPIEHFIGYLSSSSAWQAHSKFCKNITIQETIDDKLINIYKRHGRDQLICKWPVFILFSKK